LVGILVALGNHGLPIVATRQIPELIGAGDISPAASLYSWLGKWQTVSLLVLAVVFAAGVGFIEPIGWSEHFVTFTAICIICFLPKAYFLFHTSVAKGHGAFWVEANANMILSIVYTLGVVAVAALGGSLLTNLWWFAGVSAAHLVLMKFMLRRTDIKGTKEPLSPELKSRVTVHLRWASIQVFVAALSNRTIEVYLLARLIGPAEVGYFAIATNLVRGGIELVSSSLTTILMPSLAHARGSGGREQVNVIICDTLRYFGFLGGLTAGLGWLLAEPGVSLLYGPRYELVAHTVQIMAVFSGFFLIETPFSAALATLDDHRFRTFLTLLFFGLSACLALTLVPRYGLLGAVAANGMTRFTTFLLCSLWVKRSLALKLPWLDAMRTLTAVTLAMALALLMRWLIDGVIMQWVSGLVYAVALTAMTLMLGLWKPKDIHLLLKITQRFPVIGKLLGPLLRKPPSQTDSHTSS